MAEHHALEVPGVEGPLGPAIDGGARPLAEQTAQRVDRPRLSRRMWWNEASGHSRTLTANAHDPHHISLDPNLPHCAFKACSRRELAGVGRSLFDLRSRLSCDFGELVFALGQIKDEFVRRAPLEQHVELPAILRGLL